MSTRGKKAIYFILIITSIILGLATRKFATVLPLSITTYGGDVLFAFCMYFFNGFLLPEIALYKIFFISLLICISIEISQLYQAGWIQKVRHTPPFGIFLGYGFLWSDLLCYAMGAGTAFLVASLVGRKGYIKK